MRLVAAVMVPAMLGWAEAKVPIVVQVDPPGAGFILGKGLYPLGSTVVLEAEPAPGFRFVAWEEDGVTVSTTTVLQFVAETDRQLIARFAELINHSELSGRWEAKISLLPGPALRSSRLELGTRWDLFGVTGTLSALADFSASGWRSFYFKWKFTGEGLSLSGRLTMDPVIPGYKSSYLGLTGSWSELRWSLWIRHSAFGGVPPGPYLLYKVNIYLPPVSLTVQGEDGVDGLRFNDLLVRINEVPFLSHCLGVRVQGSLFLTKEEGFSYAELEYSNLFQLCCGVPFKVRVRFTPHSKALFLTPRWPRLTGCLSVYGDVVWDKETFSLNGFALYAYRVRCCFDCGRCPGSRISGPYLELATALDPSRMPSGFRGDEFEYWKLGTCGPACCGGYWTLESTIYFSHSGNLFGLSRLLLTGSIPLLPGLVWEWEAELDFISGVPSLSMSWRCDF